MNSGAAASRVQPLSLGRFELEGLGLGRSVQSIGTSGQRAFSLCGFGFFVFQLHACLVIGVLLYPVLHVPIPYSCHVTLWVKPLELRGTWPKSRLRSLSGNKLIRFPPVS